MLNQTVKNWKGAHNKHILNLDLHQAAAAARKSSREHRSGSGSKEADPILRPFSKQYITIANEHKLQKQSKGTKGNIVIRKSTNQARQSSYGIE